MSMSHSNRRVAWFLQGVCAAVVFIASLPVVAENDTTDLAAQLSKIRADVDTAESEKAKMKEEFAALLAKRTQLEESLRKIKEEDKTLQRKIGDMKARAVVLTTEVEISEEKAREQQLKIQSRLRSMYVNSSVSMSPVVAGHAARGDVERLSIYARKVRDLDSKLLKDASQAVAALIQSRAALEEAMVAQESLREQLVKKRQDAENESAKLRSVTEQLKTKQRAAQESLALLQSEARKVEEMIASLTSGADQESDEEVEVGDEPANLEDASPEAPTVQKTVLHPSLFEPSARVSAPVKGEVLQSFGRSKLTSFADMIRSKGIEFATPSNSDVFVVSAGKVVFAGVMPGYDQVAVVEHGGRSYSLYGRLGSVSVKVGDLVEKDQKIATTSAPDEKGRNFYFEVRRNGSAVDPETVLTKVSR